MLLDVTSWGKRNTEDLPKLRIFTDGGKKEEKAEDRRAHSTEAWSSQQGCQIVGRWALDFPLKLKSALKANLPNVTASRKKAKKKKKFNWTGNSATRACCFSVFALERLKEEEMPIASGQIFLARLGRLGTFKLVARGGS